MTNTTPLVSVCMITYNHEKFIREAIEGVLMQKTNFPIELIIGEDCSTDNTREIVMEYAGKFPGIIKPLLPDKNLGMSENFMQTLQACTGKYIALCEGDDYWTDPKKLQIQVDCLEENNNLIAIATNSSVCDYDGNIIKNNKDVIPPDNRKGQYNLHDFFSKGIQYPTLTVVFRNDNMEFIHNKMNEMANPFLGDWILWVLLHTFGDFYFLNQVTASYRINPNSVTHTVNVIKRWEEDFIIRRKLKTILFPEFHKYLKSDYYAYHMMAMAYRKQKKIAKFFLFEVFAFLNNPILFTSIIRKLFIQKTQK